MLKKISKARKEMLQIIGREPSAPELAHYMEIPEEKLRKYTSSSRTVVSLEMPLRSGGSYKEDTRTIGELLISDAPTPEEDVQNHYLKEDIRSVLNDLPKRERDVLNLRYGLENGESLTLSDTAKHMKISEDSVRLVEARALNKLRSPQRNYKLKEYVIGKLDEENTRPPKKEQTKKSPAKMWF
jgi:RNA polymerase primary sigma factor